MAQNKNTKLKVLKPETIKKHITRDGVVGTSIGYNPKTKQTAFIVMTPKSQYEVAADLYAWSQRKLIARIKEGK